MTRIGQCVLSSGWAGLLSHSLPCSRVGRRGPRAPPDGKISMAHRGPYHYQVYGNTCYQVQKYPHGGHLALYRSPKDQFWVELGQMSQCHINRFEWSCNMSKWGFSTMLSTMVTFLFWLEVSVINKSKMVVNCHIGFCRKIAYGCWWYHVIPLLSGL